MDLTAKNKKIYLIGGAIGVGIVGWIYLHNKSGATSAASDSSSIDPATGFAYGSAQDTAALAAQTSDTSDIDPSTGYPYGSAQDEAVLSTAAQDTGAAASSTYNPVSTAPVAAQTNAAWAQAATATLVAIGYSAETVAGALGAYLGGIGLTATQVTIVQAALAEDGPPPVGTFSIIAASPAPGSSGTGSTSGTTASTVTIPNLAGQSAGSAHNALVSLGLVPTAPAGQTATMKVSYTNPGFGAQVAKGSKVLIETSGYVTT